MGSALLHTGVSFNDREYAYGGHDHPGISGVYWTQPRMEPPGGTFRCELRHGLSTLSASEITSTIQDVAERFQGTSYNLLSNNCNHFTSYFCQRLTGLDVPAWLNRAAGIGLMLPCLVPQEWVVPPGCDVDEDGSATSDLDDELHNDERSMMIQPVQHASVSDQDPLRQDRVSFENSIKARFRGASINGSTGRDSEERILPPSEVLTS